MGQWTKPITCPPPTRFFCKMIFISWSAHSPLNKLQCDDVSPAPPAVVCPGQAVKGLQGRGRRLSVAKKVYTCVIAWAVVHTGRLPGTSGPGARPGPGEEANRPAARAPRVQRAAGQRPLGAAGSRQRPMEFRRLRDATPSEDGCTRTPREALVLKAS